MRNPQIGALSSEQATRILDRLDSIPDAATAFGVSEDVVKQWRGTGVEQGPVAGCLRYFARLNRIDSDYTSGACVLCAGDGVFMVCETPLCNRCFSDPGTAAEQAGYQFVEDPRYIMIDVGLPFELPLHATFSAQYGHAKDPEVGDDEFDADVQIETPDYEMLFDMFQLQRRRDLTQALVKRGRIKVDVDDISFFPDGGLTNEIRQQLVLLAWSLAVETSPFR